MTDTLKGINPTPHLCRSKVKQTALEIAAAIRPANKFSRVGMSFVERIEAKVRAATTMMASSTTKPIANTKAKRVSKLIE